MKYASIGQPKREMGDKVIAITSDGTSETLQGYRISTWDSEYKPLEVELAVSKPVVEWVATYDEAYDYLFGTPTKPQFGKNVLA